MTPALYRQAFIVLLGAAMNFREMYFRDDIETIKASEPPSADAVRTAGTRRVTQKKVNQAHHEAVRKRVDHILSINKRIYKEIEDAKKSFQDGGKAASILDDLITHITVCNEELLVAKDAKQVAAILKLNNSGMFDEIFKKVADDAAAEAETTETAVSDPQQ